MSILIDNRKATFNYELKDKYEAGIELVGHEVKALKSGRGNLTGSYVSIRGGEAFLVGLEIPEYQVGNTPDGYDPKRIKRLLLSKKELAKLTDIENQKGLTLIPITLYNKGRVIKCEFAVGVGKKKHDKRQSIKERETNREIERTLKNRR
jgi:SsrA-binding protein